MEHGAQTNPEAFEREAVGSPKSGFFTLQETGVSCFSHSFSTSPLSQEKASGVFGHSFSSRPGEGVASRSGRLFPPTLTR